MTGRSGRRRRDPSSPLVDLAEVFADDEMVDAIAALEWGSDLPRMSLTESSSLTRSPQPRSTQLRSAQLRNDLAARGLRAGRTGLTVRDPSTAKPPATGRPQTVDPLTELFAIWRAELAAIPVPAPPPVHRHVVPKVPMSRRRALRPALSIAAAIAMLLAGSATVGAKSANPEDMLWPITVMMWPDRAQSVASVQEVREALAQARSAIDNGRPEDAQLALLRAAVQLGNVDDVDGRADMELAVTDLWAASVPADQAPTADVHQVDKPNWSTGPAAPRSSPGVVPPAAGPTTATPAQPLAAALSGLVPLAPSVADPVAGRGSVASGNAGSVGQGSVGSGSAANGAGQGVTGASSGSGVIAGTGGSSGSGDVVTAQVAAPVAMPTPPVSVETSTVPAPAASATEQSPPTPSQTTDPTEPGEPSGGKPTDGVPLIIDGTGSESIGISGEASASSAVSAAAVANTAGDPPAS